MVPKIALIVMLWGWFLIDLWNRVLLLNQSVYDISIMPSGVIRTALVLLVLLWVFIIKINKRTVSQLFALTLVVIFLVLTVFYDLRSLSDVKYIIKLCSPFIFFILFRDLEINKFEFVTKQIKWIFLFHIAVVFIGLISNFDLFRSYPYSNRLGFSGIIPRTSISDATVFSMILVVFLFRETIKSKLNVSLFVLSLIGVAILGTKAIYLYLLLFGVYYFLFFIKDNRVKKLFVILTILTSTFLIIFFCTNFFQYYIDLYNEKGFWYTVTSKRNTHLTEVFMPYLSQIGFWQLLCGGGGFPDTLIEMDLFDLFIEIGIVGIGIYIYVLKSTLFNFTKNNHLALFFIFGFLIISFVSGHGVASGLNAIFLPFLCLYLQQDNLKEKLVLRKTDKLTNFNSLK